MKPLRYSIYFILCLHLWITLFECSNFPTGICPFLVISMIDDENQLSTQLRIQKANLFLSNIVICKKVIEEVKRNQHFKQVITPGTMPDVLQNYLLQSSQQTRRHFYFHFLVEEAGTQKASSPEITLLSNDGAAVQAVLQTQSLFYIHGKSIYSVVSMIQKDTPFHLTNRY